MRFSGTNVLARHRQLFIACVLGVIVACAFVLWRIPTATAIPALGFFIVPLVGFGVLGIAIAFRFPRTSPHELSTNHKLHAFAVAATLGFAVAALASVAGQATWKPITFYVAYALACVALSAQALAAPRRAWAVALVVISAAILLALFAATTQLLTPEGFGSDTIFHRNAAEGLATTGSHKAIETPYDLFPAMHDTLALALMLGASPRVALVLLSSFVGLATLTAGAFFLGRAFGPRVAMMGAALLAASPGLLVTIAMISPSKMGAWMLLAALALFSMPGVGARTMSVVFGLGSSIYHPTLALTFLLGAATYVGLVHVIGVGWLARKGERFGFGQGGPVPKRLRYGWVIPLGIVGLGAGALVWTARTSVQARVIVTGPL
ncbi:MAG: hypothetical protein WDA16_13090, partial [Candidatus Thermoplasmatota archaeon]